MLQYSKFLVALGGWFALLGESLAGNGVDAAEAGALVMAGLAAVGVYQARNRQSADAAVETTLEALRSGARARVDAFRTRRAKGSA